MPDSRRGRRRVQGPLRQGRRAARAVGLRRRRAVRSDREEALLPRPPGRARLQRRHARLRPALLVLPELGDLAGAARSGGGLDAGRRDAAGARRRCGPPRRAGRRLHLQRAAHHRRVGRRDLQGGPRRGAPDRVRFERQRHAAGARFHPALDRSLQGRSQELRRPALPAAGRTSRSDPVHDPPAARDGRVARDRHASDSRVQRHARRVEAADGVHRLGVAVDSRGT